MLIAIVGCLHGELDNVYDNIKTTEEKEGIKVDLLICCGDFQSTRNIDDLRCMAVPLKYQDMCSFYKYYSGEKVAPVLTLFIGGNHEASNYLQELPYGGWVAPNIFYLGYAGVVNYGGLKIAGLSGIYKGADYLRGHFEKPPYSESTKRSVYHIRNLEVFRLKQISDHIDIMISHDWPKGICEYGNSEQLLRHKPFFREEIENDQLGSEPGKELLHHLKPSYWLAAHLHTKFVAVVPHVSETDDESEDKSEPIKSTRFLALDKCLQKRRYLQLLEIPSDPSKPKELEYDLEWLTILFLTNHLLGVDKSIQYMPGPCKTERWIFTPSKEEMELVLKKFDNDLKVPQNFVKTAEPFSPRTQTSTPQKSSATRCAINPQTASFCSKLSVDDPLAILSGHDSSVVSQTTFDSPSMFSDVSAPTVESPPSFILPKPKYDDSLLSESSFPSLFEDSQNCTEDLSSAQVDSKEQLADSENPSENLSSKQADSQKPSSDSQARIPDSQTFFSDSQSQLSELSTDTTDVDAELNKSSPTKKKFKRRNLSLYCSNSEETSN